MILYLILILSFPLMKHPLFGHEIAGLTVEKYLGIACLGYALIHLMRRGRSPWKPNRPTVLAYVLFYLMALGSYLLTQGESGSALMLVYTSHLIFLFITVIVVDTVDRLRWALLASVASVALASLYALREWQKGVDVYGIGYRPGWVTGDANYFTASAVAGVLLCLVFLHKQNRGWQRMFAIGCLALSTFAVLVASSRGGFLGLVAGLLMLVARSQRRARNLVAVLVLSAIVLAVAPQSPLRRFLNPTHSDIAATDSRLETWSSGLKMIAEQPITGVGLGNFRATALAYGSDDAHLAHNTYIEIAAEMGIPALLVFIGLQFSAWLALERSRRVARQYHATFLFDAATGLQAAMLAVCVAIVFLSAEFLKVMWFLVFLATVMPRLATSVKSQAIPARETEPEEAWVDVASLAQSTKSAKRIRRAPVL